MSISKSLKKKALKGYKTPKEGSPRRQLSWAYQIGDLVKIKSENKWGIVIECHDTYFKIMTYTGSQLVLPKTLDRVQVISSKS